MLTVEQMEKIAKTYGRTTTCKELAAEFGTTKISVFQAVNRMRKRGVNIPKLRNKVMEQVIENISRECPELLKK